MVRILIRILAAASCALAAASAGVARAASRPPWQPSHYEAISALRDGPDDVLLVARGRCGHRPKHDCVEVFRSADAGRSWTRTRRPPGPLSESTLTAVGPHAAWLTEVSYHQAAHSYLTTDDGAHWRKLRLTNIESVATMGTTIYAAKAHSLFAGTEGSTSLHWIGPSVGGQLATIGENVYNYPTAYDRKRRRALRVVAIRAETIAAVSSPCPNFGALNVALSTDEDGSVVAMCAGEPGMGEQPKRSFVSWNGGTTWQRSGKPSFIGYVGAVAAHGIAGTFVAAARAPLQATYDDGRSWHFVNVHAPDAADGEWRVGFDVTGAYGWTVVGTSGSALYLTDDGGRTWHPAAPARLPT
jgi:photosystem II stability/assembly factor-like uncharacterized protein